MQQILTNYYTKNSLCTSKEMTLDYFFMFTTSKSIKKDKSDIVNLNILANFGM